MTTPAEHEFERVRGLPGDLPAGERILWQGSPRWTRLASEAFHVRAVAGYFALMLAVRAASAIGAGEAPAHAAAVALSVAPVATLGVALLAGWAWATAKTTVYTITDKRVVLRLGVAVPKAFNIPLAIVETGAVKAFADGSGDVSLALKAPNKLAFLHLWPHVRPWKAVQPQPTFRAVPDAEAAGRVLTQAMRAYGAVATAPVTVEDARASQGLAPEAAAA